MVMGDAPPNTVDEFKDKRSYRGEQYWNEAIPGLSSHQTYVDQLKNNGIPIHSVMMNSYCATELQKMSDQTGGTSFMYNDGGENASKHITEIVVSKILSSVGNSEQGKMLVNEYKN